MGLARDALQTLTLAATAGIAIGGAFGLLAPAFAEAAPGPEAAAAHSPEAPAAHGPEAPAAHGPEAPSGPGREAVAAPGAEVAAPAVASAPALVTSVDLLGTDRLEITVRFTNTGGTTRHIDTAALVVTAGTTALHPRTTDSVDLSPGTTVEETVTFDAPSPDAALALTLPDGTTLPLG